MRMKLAVPARWAFVALLGGVTGGCGGAESAPRRYDYDYGSHAEEPSEFVLDRDTARPVVFHAVGADVEATDTGYAVTGELVLDTPLGGIAFSNANVSFDYGDDRDAGLQTLFGTARAAFPALGALAGFA